MLTRWIQSDEVVIAVARSEAATMAAIVAVVAMICLYLMIRAYARKDHAHATTISALVDEVRMNRQVVEENTEAFERFAAASEAHTRALQAYSGALRALAQEIEDWAQREEV